MPTSALAPTRFALSIPTSWYDLDLAPASIEARLRAAVLARAGDDPVRQARAREMADELRQIAGTARRRGALYAAGMVELLADGLLSATLMVSRVEPPPGVVLDPLAEVGRLRSTGGADVGGTWRRVLPVDLPHAGPAGRVVGLDDLPLDLGPVRHVLMHTVVPVPGSRAAMVITCGSPNVRQAAVLLDLFDSITATFRFLVEPPR